MRHWYYGNIIFIAMFLFLVASVTLASTSAQVQSSYDGISAMQSRFTQVLSHKESGAKETRKGTLTFKKPFLVHWEVVTPAPELLVVSPKEIWNVFPDESVAYKYSLDMIDSSVNIVRVITGQARLDQDFMAEEKGIEDGLKKIQLYPNQPAQALVEATLWVDPVTNLIKKVLVYDFYGNQNYIAFEQQDTTITVQPSFFTYSPPSSLVIEDRTQLDATSKNPLLN